MRCQLYYMAVVISQQRDSQCTHPQLCLFHKCQLTQKYKIYSSTLKLEHISVICPIGQSTVVNCMWYPTRQKLVLSKIWAIVTVHVALSYSPRSSCMLLSYRTRKWPSLMKTWGGASPLCKSYSESMKPLRGSSVHWEARWGRNCVYGERNTFILHVSSDPLQVWELSNESLHLSASYPGANAQVGVQSMTWHFYFVSHPSWCTPGLHS